MPAKRTTASGYEHAKLLRKEPTPAEIKLWEYLRKNKLKGIYFRRQHAFGKYIADFCAIKQKIIIELDGIHHKNQGEYDQERTRYFENKGFKIIRFWNNQVMNDIEGVLQIISNKMKP
jgi:5-methyltetrahydrofolate--homocysteine methyltransferase